MIEYGQPELIVSLLNEPIKPIVLLGAGASKLSGVMLVTEIVEEAALANYSIILMPEQLHAEIINRF